MYWKIISLVTSTVIALPVVSGKVASAVAVSLNHQERLSSGLLSVGVQNNSLLLSGRYDEDRDEYRECYHKFREAYRNIDRDRRELEDADSEHEHYEHERKLERDFRRLEDLRQDYSECDYRGNNREYREYHDYHDYHNEYPGVQLPPRPIPPYPPE